MKWTFYSPIATRAARVCLLCALFALVALFVPAPPGSPYASFRLFLLLNVVAMPLFGATLWLMRHSSRVVLSEAGIETTTPKGKRRMFRWDEITSLDPRLQVVTPLIKEVKCVIPFDVIKDRKFRSAILDLAPDDNPLRHHIESQS